MVGATNSNCRLGSDCAHSFHVVFRHCDYIVDIQNIHAKFPGSCLSLHSAKGGKRKISKKSGGMPTWISQCCKVAVHFACFRCDCQQREMMEFLVTF